MTKRTRTSKDSKKSKKKSYEDLMKELKAMKSQVTRLEAMKSQLTHHLQEIQKILSCDTRDQATQYALESNKKKANQMRMCRENLKKLGNGGYKFQKKTYYCSVYEEQRKGDLVVPYGLRSKDFLDKLAANCTPQRKAEQKEDEKLFIEKTSNRRTKVELAPSVQKGIDNFNKDLEGDDGVNIKIDMEEITFYHSENPTPIMISIKLKSPKTNNSIIGASFLFKDPGGVYDHYKETGFFVFNPEDKESEDFTFELAKKLIKLAYKTEYVPMDCKDEALKSKVKNMTDKCRGYMVRSGKECEEDSVGLLDYTDLYFANHENTELTSEVIWRAFHRASWVKDYFTGSTWCVDQDKFIMRQPDDAEVGLGEDCEEDLVDEWNNADL